MQGSRLRVVPVLDHAAGVARPDADSQPSSGSASFPKWAVVLREPLTHFLALGLLIFGVAHYLQTQSGRYFIDLGPSELRRIALSYAQQYGASPSASEMKAMTDDYIRQEILLREGLALGLDKDDEIVRRRIAQKFEFLLQDRAVARDLSEAGLRKWFASHRSKYTIPPRRTFDHLYFAIDQRGEDAAHRLSRAALAALRNGGVVPKGDEFPGPPVIRLLSRADTDRLFGGEGFAAEVFAAPKGLWAGPYRSAFGWHLIRVTEDQPAQPRDFAAARNEVLTDWKEADRATRNEAAYVEIRGRYRVAGQDR